MNEIDQLLKSHAKTREDFAYDVYKMLRLFRYLGMTFDYAKIICGTVSEMSEETERDFSEISMSEEH